MKIANTALKLPILLLAVITLPGVGVVSAQVPEPVSIPPASESAPAVAANSPAVAVTTVTSEAAPAVAPAADIAAAPVVTATTPAVVATTSPTVVTTASPIVAPAMPTTLSTATTAKPPANLPTGTPEVVTQVMENLQASQSNVSVEDLSKAQDALARLDLLLQLEKKIGEIKKTQDERDPSAGGIGGGGMMGSVPASALVMPNGMNGGMGNGMMNNGMNQGAIVQSSPVISSVPTGDPATYEVEQISGTNGSYNAILTTPDGDVKTVREGDKLDGRTVQSISLDGVQLSAAKGSKKGGKTLTIHNDAVMLTPMAR